MIAGLTQWQTELLDQLQKSLGNVVKHSRLNAGDKGSLYIIRFKDQPDALFTLGLCEWAEETLSICEVGFRMNLTPALFEDTLIHLLGYIVVKGIEVREGVGVYDLEGPDFEVSGDKRCVVFRRSPILSEELQVTARYYDPTALSSRLIWHADIFEAVFVTHNEYNKIVGYPERIDAFVLKAQTLGINLSDTNRSYIEM